MAKGRRREKACAAETPMAWKLPTDLLLEIIARSDLRTLVRCAATCNLLRCKILSQPFDGRVVQAAACVLAHLRNDDAKKPLALVHPTTPAAFSFCHKHLPRFMSRKVGNFLGEYKPVASRRGLVVLRRINIKDRSKSDRCSDMCVYDPMSGARTFFSDPPEIRKDHRGKHKYVLLTASDGINTDSFLLLVVDIHGDDFRVHTTSSNGTWGPVRYGSKDEHPWGSLKKHGEPAILRGGVIHWLPSPGKKIQSYDVGIETTGWVKLPRTMANVDQLYLATSSEGKLLKLLAIKGFKMSVWLQLPVSAVGGSGWSLETVIDMKKKLRSLDPCITQGIGKRIEFEGSGNRTGTVVFLVDVGHRPTPYGYIRDVYSDVPIVFDLETKKMHRQKHGSTLLEIDLLPRLQAMKMFP